MSQNNLKYLQTYKLFESSVVWSNKTREDISDILFELEDSNFVVSNHFSEVKKVSNKLCDEVIEIVIDKGGSQNFSYSEIEDTCNRLISYMTGWNWSLMYFDIYNFVEFKAGGSDPLQTKYEFTNPYYKDIRDSLLSQKIGNCQAFKVVFYSSINRVIEKVDKIVESTEIPDHFIDLRSIGYVLDPYKGVMYAKWKAGGYDEKNPYEVDFDNSIEGLNTEETLEVEKWWKSCEEWSHRVNFSLIKTAEDLALEWIDKGLSFSVLVIASRWSGSGKLQVYYLNISSEGDSEKWYRYFPEKMEIVERGLIQYKFTVRETKPGMPVSMCELYNSELRSKLSEMFPQEVILD